MFFALIIIIFPTLVVIMFINVLRVNRISRKYKILDFFRGGTGPTATEWRKIGKYFTYFLLSGVAFIVFLFIMAIIQELLGRKGLLQ
jgi:uncharacterized membrane protein